MTQAAPPEVLAELQSLRKIVDKFRNPYHAFQLIVSSRTKTSISWAVDINTATLGMLSTRICEEYSEFKDSTLSFDFKLRSTANVAPTTNKQLQALLRSRVAQNEMTVTVAVITPTKPFSDWTLKEVWELYGFEHKQADLLHFPPVECHHMPLDNNEILPLLVDNLNRLYRTTPLFLGVAEATRSLCTLYTQYCSRFNLSVHSRFRDYTRTIPRGNVWKRASRLCN